MMILGNLRYPIQILSKSVTKDEYGAETIVWNTVMSLKADVTFGKGKKEVSDSEVFNKQIVFFTILYREIKTDNRIFWDGKKYSIDLIDGIGFKEGLKIHTQLINE